LEAFNLPHPGALVAPQCSLRGRKVTRGAERFRHGIPMVMSSQLHLSGDCHPAGQLKRIEPIQRTAAVTIAGAREGIAKGCPDCI
jgi:hypothetical protein